MTPNRTIEDAPRDGRIIVVGAEGVGEFLMAWSDEAENAVFAPGVRGMWESADQTFTWVHCTDGGPTYWRPMDGCTLPVPPRPRLGRH